MWGAKSSTYTALAPEYAAMPYQSISNAPVPQFKNGRVIGVSDSKRSQSFELFTENNNNGNLAKNTILYGTLTRSVLSDAFFSNKNMGVLQCMLKNRVYMASGGQYKIGNQNNNSLLVIMRAMYLQYAKHLPYNISGQIKELNRYVIEYSLPRIMTNIKQHIEYIRNLETLPAEIPLPINVSSAGTRTLKSVTTTF